jgi:superfamily II RNA helicase
MPRVAERRALSSYLPAGPVASDELLTRFLDWCAQAGFELYPAQEEALLELWAGKHVVLSTPTGSGKSLVALGLHFKAMAEGRTSYYTSPIKALASEKFFALCDELGAERVGMMTGDASINPEAAVLCCTAEVLANMALRSGPLLDAPEVVMDEFHYYSDPERGWAWQVPLVTLPGTRFLLMSATLGDMTAIGRKLAAATGRAVARVSSAVRPVPLDYEWRETPLHETIDGLLRRQLAPVYVVSFTQRECAELAQALTSTPLTSREEREALRAGVAGFRFDTPYGKEIRRYVTFGVGLHHAGLLPKYRLLVEQLSQQALLKVICGTDTLGVGVNIPIRTVLFNRLCKYDGTKTAILSVRDFKQIAGRAGRKGFDDRGFVVCQAPEHVIENLRIDRKVEADPKRKRKLVKKKPPERGFVPWDEKTFRKLIDSPPETLESRFRVTHGMLLNLLQHDAELDDAERDNLDSLRDLIGNCHEDDETKRRLLGEAAVLVRSLYRAGIIGMSRDRKTGYRWVTVNEDLQFDFSLFQSLSLYLVETLEVLDPAAPEYALDLLSLVEAILEDPQVVLRRQADTIKDQLVAELKAEGVEYEERMERLQEVTHPKPNAELVYATFDAFRRRHPWVGGENIRPKGVGRELASGFLSFEDFVRRYGLQRSEGILLRYVSQLYKTLTQTVPDQAKTDEVYDMLGYFRALVSRVDTSLLEEWESLLDPATGLSRLAGTAAGAHALEAYELTEDPRALRARIRGELHQLVRALAQRDFEEAALLLRREPAGEARQEAAGESWDAARLEAALEPFFSEYGEIVFTPAARQAHLTRFDDRDADRFTVTQVLLDPADDDLWCLEGWVDRRAPGSQPRAPGPLFRLRRIGT